MEERNKEEEKIIEEEIVKEEINPIQERQKEESKNKLKDFFTSKVFLCICTFFLGIFIMYITSLTNKGVTLVQKVTNENIKTTTVEEESDLKKAINNVYESTIYIEVSSNKGTISSGSGFVYKEDDRYGYILTNYHVIDGGNKFNVTFTDGSDADAQLISGDEYYDIAVLKVTKDKIKSISAIGNSSNLELGDTVFTVGAPLGKEYMGTITKGIVSGINRMVSVQLGSGNYLMEVIQTDAPINSGNSGGPICNIKGEVVGITSSKLAGTGIEGMGFAIPINSVMDVIENIETGKQIVRPYLGVQLVDLTNTFALQYYYGIKISSDVEFGAVLSYVEEKKPADKAGLKTGDVIVEIDGEKIDDVSHFKYVLYKHKVGDSIKVKYYRENKLEETTIVLSEAIENE
jgi:serine protease Do